MHAGVAAGHPATAEVGVEILDEGGTAGDAVVAMAFASCVAETVLSGLLSGCHAVVFDGTRARNLDGFATVPAGTATLTELPIAFGEEIVTYSIGPASCAVPGLPATLDALWRALGRLPWRRLVEPALRLARTDVQLPPMHARSLEMLAPLYTLERGAELYAPDGHTLGAGDALRQPGLVAALEALADEGASSVYSGTIADALLAVDGVVVTRDDLESYEATWRDPVEVSWNGRTLATRGGLSGIPELLPRLPRFADLSATERVVALVDALEPAGRGGEHTTNMVAVDADGRACVLTHSLGVGAGVWVPGYDLQLNNLLGESDIAFGDPRPRERLESRMAPSLVFDRAGLELAIGAAGATRLRTALCGVLVGILDEGLAPVAAVARPRAHPVAGVVDAEPGVDDGALAVLEARGWRIRRWDRLHHYFGGVSCVGRTGAAGDPRRSGVAIVL
jgi:gamma-glutamyltranspeptidase/glutathione hydrolase